MYFIFWVIIVSVTLQNLDENTKWIRIECFYLKKKNTLSFQNKQLVLPSTKVQTINYSILTTSCSVEQAEIKQLLLYFFQEINLQELV